MTTFNSNNEVIRKEGKMKSFFRKLARKSILALPWVLLTVIAVYSLSQAIADWHYHEFIEPLIQEQPVSKLTK